MDKHRIGAKGTDAVQTLLAEKVVDDIALQDRDPVFAYTLIATDGAIPQDQKTYMLTSLRNQNEPEFSAIFDAVDRTVGEELDHGKIDKEQRPRHLPGNYKARSPADLAAIGKGNTTNFDLTP